MWLMLHRWRPCCLYVGGFAVIGQVAPRWSLDRFSKIEGDWWVGGGRGHVFLNFSFFLTQLLFVWKFEFASAIA